MKSSNRIILAIITGVLAVATVSCNNSLGGFAGSVGNTPDTTPSTAYKIFGNIGMPFTALISDSRSSWTVQGTAPISISIANSALPARMIVTKLVSDNSLMSVEILNGISVSDVASTSDPFGTAQVQIGGKLLGVAATANPSVQIYVPGPFGEPYQGLIEDTQVAFTIADFAPAVYLFDSPDGSVTGQFFQSINLGGLLVIETVNGAVVDSGVAAKVVVKD
ncbi:MAG TPA: hypothetical protein VMA09_16315 [Candidatus Binataceae bacterium]|nr:hypothetical protein [Candidatus Binataceae bacterium]